MRRRDLVKAGLAGISAMAFSHPVRAVVNFVNAPKKSWAILYGTQCGSSRDAALWINDGLGGIADVIDLSTGPKVDDYASIIIGGPIQANKLLPPVKNFITANSAALKPKIKALFTLCGNTGSTTLKESTIKSYLTDQIVQLSGVTDKPARLFLGRSTPDCGGMTYDNLKKADCEAFGKEILNTSANTIRPGHRRRFALRQNYPDPFNPITTISYSLPEASSVLLTVSTLSGRTIATLFSGFQTAGDHEVVWDGSDLSPGYYLYRLQSGIFTQTRISRRVGY